MSDLILFLQLPRRNDESPDREEEYHHHQCRHEHLSTGWGISREEGISYTRGWIHLSRISRKTGLPMMLEYCIRQRDVSTAKVGPEVRMALSLSSAVAPASDDLSELVHDRWPAEW